VITATHPESIPGIRNLSDGEGWRALLSLVLRSDAPIYIRIFLAIVTMFLSSELILLETKFICEAGYREKLLTQSLN